MIRAILTETYRIDRAAIGDQAFCLAFARRPAPKVGFVDFVLAELLLRDRPPVDLVVLKLEDVRDILPCVSLRTTKLVTALVLPGPRPRSF